MLRNRLEAVLSDPPALFLPVLILLSLFYRGLSSFYRFLFSSGTLRSSRLSRPVVSVGNLAVGGGGKTPLTMWLAQRLIASDIKVAVLSRGYGRTSDDLRIVEPEDSWQRVGDEPVLMVSRIKGMTVAVSKDRFAAGKKVLENSDVDLFLLDDGYQHYALWRDLDIVVVDGLRRFGNGRLLPAGILREPVSRLRYADVVVVTKAHQKDYNFESYLKKHTKAPIFWADYLPMELESVKPSVLMPGRMEPGGTFLAFCGIAGPDGFRETLARAGIEIADLLIFPDHHPYSASDVDLILEAASRSNADALVTTEKDAVRWPHGTLPLPVFALPVHPVIENEEELLEEILGLVRKARGTA